jgi:DNA-binding winged helix-turn-helix (wHTH) protein/TolB-like protein
VAAGADSIDLARAAAFALGPLRINPPTLEVVSGARRDTLEPRIMQVLVALASRRGEVVSREDLITQCWDGRSVGDDAINRCIGRLRRLAEAEGGFVIETIPRVGYRLKEIAAPTVPVEESPAPAAMPPAAVPPAKAWWRRWWVVAAGIVLVAAVTSAQLWFSRPEPLNRVAVLPLQTLGGGDAARIFGATVVDEIVGVLNENQVQAVAQSQTAVLRGPERDDAARKLGVDFILDGTVKNTPQGLRVMVHLDRASSHLTLWSASFEAGDTGIEPPRLAARVVDVIKAALEAAELRDDAAVAAYLKAHEYGRVPGRAASTLRRDQMRIVVAHAPDFSQGRSGLAWSSATLIPLVEPPAVPALRDVARREALKALELDPRNGETYLTLAALAPVRDYAEQERLYRRGLAVQPDEPTLNSSLAALLEHLGRYADALPLYERAALLDPLSPRKNASYAAALLISGRVAQARTTIERAAKRWPDSSSVWTTRLNIATFINPAEVNARLAEGHHVVPPPEPDFFTAMAAASDALLHNTPQTRAAARASVLAAVADGHFSRNRAIELLTRIGEIDAAITVAEQAFPTEPPAARPDASVLLRPSTAALRRDKRFLPLAERLGLVAYWKKHTAPDFCRTETVAPCPDLARGGR